jgi:hypothetical protein
VRKQNARGDQRHPHSRQVPRLRPSPSADDREPYREGPSYKFAEVVRWSSAWPARVELRGSHPNGGPISGLLALDWDRSSAQPCFQLP